MHYHQESTHRSIWPDATIATESRARARSQARPGLRSIPIRPARISMIDTTIETVHLDAGDNRQPSRLLTDQAERETLGTTQRVRETPGQRRSCCVADRLMAIAATQLAPRSTRESPTHASQKTATT